MKSAAHARSLLWWSARQIASVTARIDAVVVRWCADWGLAAGEGARGGNAFDAGLKRVALRWQAAGEAALWLGLPADVAARVAEALYGERVSPESLAGGIIANALDELTAQLGEALQAPGAFLSSVAPPLEHANRWSGALHFSFAVAGVEAQLALGPAHAARLLGHARVAQGKGGCVPLDEAVRCAVPVAMEPFSLAFSQLQALQAGDVICLPHRLGEPLSLALPDARRVPAALGRRGPARAVVVAPRAFSEKV